MSEWLLRDVRPNNEAQWRVNLDSVDEVFTGCSAEVMRLHGGYSDGVDVIRIVTPRHRIEVLPTRGMGIWKAEIDSVNLGWSSPVRGPVHPMWVDLSEPRGLGWLAGFDEFVVRCGLASNGAPDFDALGRLRQPLHGQIANIPARDVAFKADPERQQLVLIGTVDETRFAAPNLRLESRLTVHPEQGAFTIHDTVVNNAGISSPVQLLYHINVGTPLLENGSRLLVPAAEITPRDGESATTVETWQTCGPPGSRAHEQAYFCRLSGDALGQTGVLFHNSAGTAGLSLRFDLTQLPCFTYWKNLASESDGYVIGLEPATNYPNPYSFEAAHGRTVTLEPNGRQTFELTLQSHPHAGSVENAQQWITALVGRRQQVVHTAPQPNTCYEADTA